MQTAVTLYLVVKGDEYTAEHELIPRMQAWLGETPMSMCKDGEGFPPGALLHFRVGKMIELGGNHESVGKTRNAT